MPTAPALSGKQSEATIDQANIAMRTMPWWNDLIKSFGQDPKNVHLTHAQSAQVVKQAQAHGFVIDEGSMHVDESGNIDKKGHAVRNTLIVLGIAGATIATLGAAGAFSGAAAASSAAVSGGVEAGAVAGLGTAALPGALATLPALAGTTAAISGTAAAAAIPALTSAAAVPTAAVTSAGGGLGSMALRYGLNEGGNLVNGYLQNRAAGKAADIQQKYLDEALAYTKEQDAYRRTADEKALALEATRYGDREGRLAPYRATGVSANARMAALLGLPAPPDGVMPAPTSAAPTATQIPITSTPATSTQTTQVMSDRTMAADAPAMVTMRAPNGQTQQVPADQVAHYQERGAQVVS